MVSRRFRLVCAGATRQRVVLTSLVTIDNQLVTLHPSFVTDAEVQLEGVAFGCYYFIWGAAASRNGGHRRYPPAARRRGQNNAEKVCIRSLAASLGLRLCGAALHEELAHLAALTFGVTPGRQEAVVSRLVEGGSAQKAGIQPGDLLTGIDNVQTTGWSLEQIKSALQGAEDTFVTVGLSVRCIRSACLSSGANAAQTAIPT